METQPTIVDERRANWRRATRLFILLVVSVLMWLNCFVCPVLRFAWPPLNWIAFLPVLFAPAVAILVALRTRPTWLGWPLAVALGLPAGFSILLVPFSVWHVSDMLRTGTDAAAVPLRCIPTPSYDLRVYRTDGGATTSFGILVRQELTLLPGVRLVRDVYVAYPASDVTIEVMSDGRIAFDGQPKSLRPAIWF